jgi:ComF family protein
MSAPSKSHRGSIVAWIVPVPLHWWRHWRRGFNQAEALARALARRLDLPVRRPLRRIKATEKLAELSPTERARALRGTFRARKGPGLAGRTVLLVDDVLTTGANCGAAARALKQAGAARVVVAVIARTGKNSFKGLRYWNVPDSCVMLDHIDPTVVAMRRRR